MNIPGFSIIICTYNGEKRLRQTLASISALEIGGIDIEVIVVNNNSTDNTKNFVEEWILSLNKKFTANLIFEPNPGLSFARKSGIDASNYDWLLFCDDDNWLASDYLNKAAEILKRNPNIGALAGRGNPESDTEFPYWFYPNMGSYATGILSLNSGDVSHKGSVWGASTIFRKDILLEVFNSGFESLLHDRKGNTLSSGGDDEMCRWILLAGYKLWYDEELIFTHFIPKERLTKDYLERLLKGFSETFPVINKYQAIVHFNSYSGIKRFILSFFYLIKGLLYFPLSRGLSSQNFRNYSACVPFIGLTLDKEYKRIKTLSNALQNIQFKS